MDDSSIIKLFWQRDEKAVLELQSKYEKLIIKILKNILTSDEDVEECVNSTYLSVWNSIPPQSPDDLCAYTCKIAKRHSINKIKYNCAYKRKANLADSLHELEDCLPSDENIEDIVSAKELTNAINDFLHIQNQLDCNLFVRRYWYSDSIESIAKFYGINKKTVATKLFRTRKKLKIYLIEEGLINE